MLRNSCSGALRFIHLCGLCNIEGDTCSYGTNVSLCICSRSLELHKSFELKATKWRLATQGSGTTKQVRAYQARKLHTPESCREKVEWRRMPVGGFALHKYIRQHLNMYRLMRLLPELSSSRAVHELKRSPTSFLPSATGPMLYVPPPSAGLSLPSP